MMLLVTVLLPLFGLVIVFFSKNKSFIKNFSLFWSLLVFNFSIFLLSFLDASDCCFQYIENIQWLTMFNINCVLFLDGLTFWMFILTTFLIPICILLGWNIKTLETFKNYAIIFFLLETILLGVFCSADLLVFYVLFEAVLIPMYFIVGIFGSRERKVRASFLLFIYTLASSIFMFVAILFLYCKTSTTNIFMLKSVCLTPFEENACWLAFFLSFAVKMPLMPFHIWLPEAHCEAPTAGSVILAGILLKLGGYGFLRFSLGIFEESSIFFSPFVYNLCCFGVIYASFYVYFILKTKATKILRM